MVEPENPVGSITRPALLRQETSSLHSHLRPVALWQGLAQQRSFGIRCSTVMDMENDSWLSLNDRLHVIIHLNILNHLMRNDVWYCLINIDRMPISNTHAGSVLCLCGLVFSCLPVNILILLINFLTTWKILKATVHRPPSTFVSFWPFCLSLHLRIWNAQPRKTDFLSLSFHNIWIQTLVDWLRSGTS